MIIKVRCYPWSKIKSPISKSSAWLAKSKKVKKYFVVSGKHNGEVEGRRYFQCKEGHGVMVKPRTVSVHGINGQELLRPESYYPI